jgi:ribosomal-protein-alanine N-acetyltransferase
MSAATRTKACIKAMEEAHLAAVAALEASLSPLPWLHQHFSDSLKVGFPAWVVEEENSGRIVAYLVLMLAVDEIHILNVGVAKDRQGLGIGGHLMSFAIAWARKNGGVRMILEVRPSNTRARALYARCGFAQIGLRKDYYDAEGGKEDALCLALELGEKTETP